MCIIAQFRCKTFELQWKLVGDVMIPDKNNQTHVFDFKLSLGKSNIYKSKILSMLSLSGDK